MKTRTFRAPNVMAALQDVQRRLGPEALVLSVRQVPPGPLWQVWRTPEVEVVAASSTPVKSKADSEVASTGRIETKAAKPDAIPTPLDSSHPANHLLPPVKRPPEPASRAQPGSPSSSRPEPEKSLHPALSSIHAALIAQGIDSNFVDKVVKICTETLNPHALEDPSRLREYLGQQLLAGLRIRPESTALSERVVCLVGLSGSGKTSLCAKLAAHHRHKLGRKVSWVCADTVSAGAVSEARLYTDTLGIPLYLAYSPEDLAAAVNAEQNADLILVDTAGCNPYKETSLVELGDFLTTLPNRTTCLVATATTKDTDLDRAVAAFKPFGLRSLAITRLDETNTYGNIFNLAWRSQLPLSYFSSGPSIPSDLQPAEASRLVAALFGEGWVR